MKYLKKWYLVFVILVLINSIIVLSYPSGGSPCPNNYYACILPCTPNHLCGYSNNGGYDPNTLCCPN